MKKLFAILLLIVYLFNLIGYSLLIDYFISRPDEQMIQALDKGDYNDAALFEIKVPLDLPYSSNHPDYERWDGEIEINGIHYNYVKRKIYNDTLYLFCIPNINKTKLHDARTAYAANISETTSHSTEKKQADSLAKKGAFENEYDQYFAEYAFTIVVATCKNPFPFSAHLVKSYKDSVEQPPEFYC